MLEKEINADMACFCNMIGMSSHHHLTASSCLYLSELDGRQLSKTSINNKNQWWPLRNFRVVIKLFRGSWKVTYRVLFVQHGILIGVGISTVRRAPAVHLNSASKYLQSTLSSSIHIHLVIIINHSRIPLLPSLTQISSFIHKQIYRCQSLLGA